MKHFVIAALMAVGGTAVSADPAVGTWKTQEDDGAYAHVKLVTCGSNVCGTMTRTFNADGEYTSPNLGKPFVIDMVPAGDGTYKGQVWRPSNDKIYNGKMVLSGNALKLSGCVAGGLLCSKQTWQRLK